MRDLIRRILREQTMINEFARGSNTDEFIEKAKKVHGDKYTYDNVDYKKTRVDVDITCPKHGDFLQNPSCHLSGNGCNKCRKVAYSKKQIEWLEYLMKKENLPSKVCPVCKRPFVWRKKWKLNWDKVKYCSKKCSK